MKKLLIACSMISACALVACADAVSTTFTGTPKVEVQDWFAVTTTATNHGALAIAEGSDALCEVTSDSKFEIDSDLANPVVFTSSDSLTQELSKVSFTLDAAIVPTDALQDFSKTETAPKVAFALYQTSDSVNDFKAWVGGNAWLTLTGDNVTVPTEGTQYTLLMEFDNRAARKLVRFSVEGKILKNGNDEWIGYDGLANAAMTINFVGCGKVTSFLGNQLNILAEVVVIGGKGTVDVKKEDLNAMKSGMPQGYSTVDDFLKADAKTAYPESDFQQGLTIAEAYALGLVKNDKGALMVQDKGVLKVEADAQATTTAGIKVNLNVRPPAATDTGATVTFKVEGKKPGDANWTVFENEFTSVDQIVIPTEKVSEGYRSFKVKTNVKLAGAE